MRREKKVRQATLLDLLPLAKLAQRYNDVAPQMKNHPLDIPTFMQSMAMTIAVPSGYVSALIIEGEIRGAFWGCVTNLPWSSTKYAQDICYFVDEAYRGHGTLLIKDWIKWAEAQGVKEVCLSTASGIDTERTKKLFRKYGFTYQGEAFVKELS